MNVHDYKAIATDFRNTLEGINVESGSDEAKRKATEEVIALAHSIALSFRTMHSNFDYDKFTEACGFHGEHPIDYISFPL